MLPIKEIELSGDENPKIKIDIKALKQRKSDVCEKKVIKKTRKSQIKNQPPNVILNRNSINISGGTKIKVKGSSKPDSGASTIKNSHNFEETYLK